MKDFPLKMNVLLQGKEEREVSLVLRVITTGPQVENIFHPLTYSHLPAVL